MPVFCLFLALVGCGGGEGGRAPERRPLGVVSAAHPLAAGAGAAMLEAGGNAVDAAVATSFALGVVQQFHSGIGGGAFIVIHSAERGETIAIDARETAPAAAYRDLYIDDSEASKTGHLASGVPGLLAGLALVLERYGTKSLAETIAPALKIAEGGFEIGDDYRQRIARSRRRLASHPESARIYLTESLGVPAENFRLVQPDLGRTLRLIAEKGTGAFYEGEIAEAIAREMKSGGGLITRDDLAAYRPVVRAPVEGSTRGYRIASMPPPSSGGVHVIEILNILERFDAGKLAPEDPARLHLLSEAMKRAFADRALYLGDPDFVKVPVRGLVSKEYAGSLAAGIDPDRASKSVEAGDPFPHEPAGTSHLSVIDAEGNAVALTQTNNLNFGSGVTVPGTGIIMNNQMDDFSAAPGVPNAFGLVGSEANAIASGKRPLSSMAPTILFREGRPVLVLGAAGGPLIITAVVQVILHVIEEGSSLEDALAAPRIHHQWSPDVLVLEPGFPEESLVALRGKGHGTVENLLPSQVHAASVDWGAGSFSGAADPHGVGAVRIVFD